MPKTLIRLVQSLLIPILLYSVQPVLAHGDEPRLEISVEHIAPGGTVDVRGVDFEPETAVKLFLIGSGVELPLGELIADQEGIFLHIVALAPDLVEGTYQFRANTEDHEILSPALTVFGAPILSGEAGEPLREEDDGLLAPMPTFAPGAVPGEASQPSSQAVPEQAPVAGRNWIVVLLFAAGLIAAIAAFRRRGTGMVNSD